ncbi:uncharacterized protein LOC116208161 [Punica granatum]|uniref:Uncharacterized protein LOC116208161 n=1 Tax=Punica granatum TaxID=22663 RepID=A0A6P8DSF8_PUNGR|nr:uncharacterized protein LOC116208161 [Punica granatum]XP_031397299.1 uncharacterized protein LOC116208161 [Punica granatum]
MEAFISPIAHTETAALFFNEKVKLPKLAKLEIGRIGLKELSLHTQTPPGSLQSFRQPVMFSFPEFHGGPSFAMKRLQRLERLTCLEIYDCQQRNLFTSSQVKCLRHLRRLKIESCDILENVITNGEALATGGIVFPCLTNLKLHDLPELCSFYHERHTSCKESHEQSGRKDEDSLHHQIQPSLFWVEQVSFPSLEKLAISSIGKLKMIWHGQAAPDAFSKLTEIKVERCNKLEHVFESDMLQSFVNLEKLRITDCSSLSVIYDLQGLVVNPGVENAATTAHLKELELNGLRELKHIWNGDPTGIVSFQNLSTVDVTGCGSLAYLFPASLAESLLKLEKLSIRTSSQLEVVVADDEVDKVSDDRKLIFPQLEDLTLEKLQELKSFHSGRHILQFPLLKKLTVEGVGDLVELLASDFGSFSVPSEKGSPALQQPLFLVDKVSFPRLEELSITGMKNLATIWHGQMTEGYYFTKLKEIIVKGCDALVTIFPPNTVHALRKLEKLHVISCPSLRVIYHMQGLTQDRVEYSGQVVVGAQLKELLLQELPKLEHIWNIADPGRILSFHNLDSVKVEKCETLKYVFPPSVAKVLYNLNELWIENNRGLEEIVAAAVEKVEIAAGTSEFVFPRATSLKLSGLLGLKSFCQRRHISKWPSLEELEITSCDRIQNLFCHIDFFQEAAGNSNDVGSPPQQTLFFVDKVSFLCLERLKVSSMNSLTTIWHSQVDADSLSELIEITVEGCDKLVTLFRPGTARLFQNLEVLNIRRCRALEVVYEIEENAGSHLPGLVAVTKLKKLSLTDLANLQHIWRMDPRGILRFQNLSSVSVMGCSSLGYLFHASVAKALVQLVELEVKDSSLEVIVAEDKGVPPASTLEFVFPRATKLELSDLPQLKSFYPGKYISRWPSLRELMIFKSNKVEIFAFDSKKSRAITRTGNQAEQPLFLVDKGTFSIGETLHMQHNDNMKQIIWSGRNHPKLTCFSSGVHFHFTNLTALKVENCRSLKNILNPNMVSELPWLATLEIRDCAMLEAVIVGEKKARRRNIRLGKLRYITLESLPKLVSFCPRGCLFECPSLKGMTLKNCPEMRTFTSPHLKEKALNAMGENSKESYSSSGDIDIRREPFFSEKVSFPQLEKLRISGMKNLRTIWRGQITRDCFSELQNITVEGCDSLVTIFPPCMVCALWKLERLNLKSCSSLEVIYDMQGLAQDDMEYSDHVIVGTLS